MFFALPMGGTIRCFHSYCDLAERQTPASTRDAIMTREARPVKAMTRDERLEHIWSETSDDYRGYADATWPKPLRGERTIIVFGANKQQSVKRLRDLTDDEISAKLPVHLRYLPELAAA